MLFTDENISVHFKFLGFDTLKKIRMIFTIHIYKISWKREC